MISGVESHIKSKIIGIGTDIVSISRIEKIFRRFEGFIVEVLSEKEIEESKSKISQISYLAKRWAAKEAIGKAIGIRSYFPMNMISILNDEFGRPFLDLSKLASSNRVLPSSLSIARLQNLVFHITMSDEKDYAIAFCIVEEVNL